MDYTRFMERQKTWGHLALGNFTLGGAGGGLYVFLIPLALYGASVNTTLLSLLSIALVVAGLLCVMAEAGRPTRAFNVIRNIKSSWMTREAHAASLFVLFAFLDGLIMPNLIFKAIAWTSALAYVVSQSFMLAAAKKIPAWNTPATPPLFIALSLAAGTGIASITTPTNEILNWLSIATALLVLIIGASYIAWPGATIYFKQSLKRENTLAYLTASLAITTLAVIPACLNLPTAAGILLITGTTLTKYTIILKASYKLPTLPPIEAWQ